MIVSLALRGAVKHWKRSLVTAGAVAISCAVMLAIGSLLNGVNTSFLDSVIPNSGHIRIDGSGSKKAVNPLGLSSLVVDADGVMERIRGLQDPRITAVEKLLSFGAILVEDRASADPHNLAMRGIGVAPDTRFADNVRFGLVEGSFLPGGEGIAISQAAARLIGVRLGGSILVLVQDRSSQPWYESLKVTGIFRTESKDFDETTFYMAEPKAALMLDASGSAREIRLLLSKSGDAGAVAKAVAAVLPAAATAGSADLRIQTWQEINASIVGLLVFVNVMLGVIVVLFAVVAGTIIANTTLMSVMERLREFGTMRALGLRARELEKLILLEEAFNSLVGALFGMILGSIVVALLMRNGLDLGGMMENLGLSRYNRPKVDVLWYAGCAVTSVIVCLIATGGAARAVGSRSVAESLATAA